MTTDETEQETDGYTFRWARIWRERDNEGALRDYAQHLWRDGTERLAEARTAHAADRAGGWVRHGMIDPHVGPLRVWHEKRLLPEELAPHADLDTPAEQVHLGIGQ